MTVAKVDVLDHPGTASTFVHYIRQHSNCHKDINGISSMVYAAMEGRLNLLKALLQESDEDQDQLRLACQRAAKHCRTNVLKYLLSTTPQPGDLDMVFHAIKSKSLDFSVSSNITISIN